MDKIRTFFVFFTLAFALFSCSKEKWPRVEYRVATNSSTDISYTMSSGTVTYETISGVWSVSYRGRQGGNVFLSAVHSGIVGSTTIEVYINGDLYFSESTGFPGQLLVIDETIP